MTDTLQTAVTAFPRLRDRRRQSVGLITWLIGGALLLPLAGCGGGGGDSGSATGAVPAAAASAPAATTTNTSTVTAGTSNNASQSATQTDGGAAVNTGTTQAAQALSDFARQALAGINLIRANARVCDASNPSQVSPAADAVSWSDKLEASALAHSKDMQLNNLFDHVGSDGSQVGQRVSAQGYSWAAVGETQAAGFADLNDAFTHWANSPGHCSILMSASFTQIGLAEVDGQSNNTYRSYWTLDLARPN